MKAKRKKQTYSIFRYQLVPISTTIQPQLFDARYTSYEDLVKKKNIFFSEIVSNNNTKYRGKGYNVISRVEYATDKDIVLKFGVEKSKEYSKPDFQKDAIKDYPHVNVYINNRSDKQYIVIQNNPEAFSDSLTVANFMQQSLSPKFARFDLSIYIEQTFYESEFWETIRMYEGTIKTLKFEFIKPNISNISKSIKKVFQQIENNTNSHKTDFALHAPKNGVLENLNENNEQISGLLDYQKEGGGPSPIIKVKGIRTNIKTTKSERTIQIDYYDGPAEGLAAILGEQVQ